MIHKLFLLSFCLFLLSDCNKKSESQSSKIIKTELESFKEIPEEMIGCGCVFSKNEKDYNQQKYIYLNDYTENAVIKIQGKLINIKEQKFHTEEKRSYHLYKFKDFTLRVEILKTVYEDYESSKIYGIMTLTDKNGIVTKQNFFGYCGC